MQQTIYHGITPDVINNTRELARIGRMLHGEKNRLDDLIEIHCMRRRLSDPAAVAHPGLLQAQREMDAEIAAYYAELAGFFKDAVTRYGETQTNQLGNAFWLPGVTTSKESKAERLAMLKAAMQQ